MPFVVTTTDEGLQLTLTGSVTIRDAQELGKALTASLQSGSRVTVQAADLDDVDTCILQTLVSLRKTAAGFHIREYSEAFSAATDRCGLRGELLASQLENA